MLSFWAVAGPILIVDVANPVLLAAVVYTATTDRPVTNSLTLIAGHTLAYLGCGLLIIYGLADVLTDVLGPLLQPMLERFLSPEPGDFVVGFLLGLLLVGLALRWKSAPPNPSDDPPAPKTMGIGSILSFGALLNFVGIPFAVPYFAFINQLMQLDDGNVLANLLIYNVLYSVPFLLVPVFVGLMGPRILPFLERVSVVVDKYSAFLVPLMLGILGFLLVADALSYFSTGVGLI